MVERVEVLIVGAGMAGVSLAAALARSRRVTVLEREPQPGVHATGRSAALYAPGYGAGPIRALTRASGATFMAPRSASEPPLVRTRPTLLLATCGQRDRLERVYAEDPELFARLDGREVEAMVPIFRPGAIAAALIDKSSADIDVDALLQRYLRTARAGGGEVRLGRPPLAIDTADGGWRVATEAGDLQADVLVDAAGAWADEVASMAGIPPIGLSPRRRTAALVDAPSHEGFADWPAVIDVDERFYFKPDAGRLLVSPAEETQVEPHDAYADDEALAEGIDRIMQLTTLEVTRAPRSWAGLRTFAPDRTPVIGFADDSPARFFWLAGQGGYGIQTAPAAAELAASLVLDAPPPAFADAALLAALSPGRFA